MKADNWQTNINNPDNKVEGAEEIAQSVYLILSTVKGSDPLRPDFGSDLYRYIDKPLKEYRPRIVFSVLQALERWENRINVTKCTVTSSEAGKITVRIEGQYITTEQITINVNL